jgi:hypothetical protein
MPSGGTLSRRPSGVRIMHDEFREYNPLVMSVVMGAGIVPHTKFMADVSGFQRKFFLKSFYLGCDFSPEFLNKSRYKKTLSAGHSSK